MFTIGQALHWFDDIDSAVSTVNSVLREDSYFDVFAYTIPKIHDGSDWKSKMADEMKTKGFDVIDGTTPDYQFTKDQDVHRQLKEAYEEMWAKIYKHFRFDRSVIENFYQTFNFEKNAKVLRKVIWFDTAPNKSINAVIGYLESISAYRCYLEDHKIERGSENDPLEIVKRKFAELGNPDVDFVTPYFAYALAKKDIE